MYLVSVIAKAVCFDKMKKIDKKNRYRKKLEIK